MTRTNELNLFTLAWRWSFCLLLICTSANVGTSAEPPPNFEEHIKSIFQANCAGCHNQQRKKSGLALDQYASVMEGGASGIVIEPGDPDNSRLWHLVNHDDEPSMPPDSDPIAEDQRAMVKAWIAGGALERAGDKPVAKKKSMLAFEPPTSAGAAILPESLCRQPIAVKQRPSAVAGLACSPVAPVLAITGTNQVLLYHLDTGELLGVLPFLDGLPEAVRFSADGATLIAAGGRHSEKGWVVIYDVRSGRVLAEVGDEFDTVLAADLHLPTNRVAYGGPPKLLHISEANSGSPIFDTDKHNDWILSVAYSPDGKTLASSDRSGAIWLWEGDTGGELRPLNGHTQAVDQICWRADSKILASAGRDGTIRVWDPHQGKQIRNIKNDGEALAIALANDGTIVSTGRHRQVNVWSADGKPAASLGPLPDVGLAVAVHPNSAIAVAGDWLGNVISWDIASQKELRRFDANPPRIEDLVEELTATAEQATRQRGAADQQLLALRGNLKRAADSHERAIAQAQLASDNLGRLADVAQDENAPPSSQQAVNKDGEATFQKTVQEAKEVAETSAKMIQDLTQERAELTQQLDELLESHQSLATVEQETLARLRWAQSALRDFQKYALRLDKQRTTAEFTVGQISEKLKLGQRVLTKLEQAHQAVHEAVQAADKSPDADSMDSLRTAAEKQIERQHAVLDKIRVELTTARASLAAKERALDIFQQAYSVDSPRP